MCVCHDCAVYNEMKGAMSDPGAILYHKMHEMALPDTAYRYNSGGEPMAIPELRHEDLVAYHRDHYHPSNARFFTYGDLPPPLAALNELVLDRFEKKTLDTEVQLQKPFSKPVRHEFTCPQG